MKRKSIWVTFARKGIHAYPDAPEEVAYLRAPHRHVFKFKVTIEVRHNDREIEFHIFQRELEGLYDKGPLQLDDKSCEDLCDELLEEVSARYPGRRIIIEVSEDGECGADLEFDPAKSERVAT